MAAARLKMPPAVRRWLAKAKPDELAAVEQLARRRRRMLEHPRQPIEEIVEGIFRDHGATIDAIGELLDDR